ncbi:hypothetical protein [Devosia lacusdianchii]|jgi:hypothetical protein|uniref:hypothetical protein n=1 Tax=Devosia lacusdianchii TaxID=2917991 RepID=UPI001F06907D|nr:hypothetical protein [Devosia sp. JXJ CY 41]
MTHRIAAGVVLIALVSAPSRAQELDVLLMSPPSDFSIDWTDWDACKEASQGRGSLGWNRDFGGGYGDSFSFYDGRFDATASLLVTTRSIDGIALEQTRWCYRPDGSLANISTSFRAPLINATGEEGGDYGQRNAWITVDPQGSVSDVQGWVERDGEVVGEVGDPALQLARGCDPVALYLRVDDVQLQMESVLGDIEGNRPELEPPMLYDWCKALAAGS